MGRKPKFKLGEVVTKPSVTVEDYYVVVDHRVRGTKPEYRVIPMNGRFERYGRATWVPSNEIFETGIRSYKGSIVTYRANETLAEELGDRGCPCMCCIHDAYSRRDFKTTGQWKDTDYD